MAAGLIRHLETTESQTAHRADGLQCVAVRIQVRTTRILACIVVVFIVSSVFFCFVFRYENLATELAKNRDALLDLKLRVEYVSISVSTVSAEVDVVSVSAADERASLEALSAESIGLRCQSDELREEIRRINGTCGLTDDKSTTDSSDSNNQTCDNNDDDDESRALLATKHSLMETVEHVYGQAVTSQTQAGRYRANLQMQLRAANEELRLASEHRGRLDDCVRGLEDKKQRMHVEINNLRNKLEVTIQELKSAVRPSLAIVVCVRGLMSMYLYFFVDVGQRIRGASPGGRAVASSIESRRVRR